MALYLEGLAQLDELPAEPELLGNRALIEIGAAAARFRQGRFDECVEFASRAAAHAEETGDEPRLAHAYYLTAAAYNELGHPDGIAFCLRALPIYEKLHDYLGLGRTQNNLGIRLYYDGRWDESVVAYRRGRDALERGGDVVGEATLANNVGEVLSDQGYLEEATESFRHFARVARGAGYPLGEGAATSNLGRVEARAGRFEDAHLQFAAAGEIFERIGSAHFLLETRARTAECLVFEGRHAEAIALLDGALEDEQAVGTVRVLIERTLGLALWQAGRRDESHAHLEESSRIARELHAEFELGLTLWAMGNTDFADADARRAESTEILERLGVVSVPTVPLP